MQKIYSGKQLDILYAQAAQLDKLSAQDHIERAAVAFERELLRHYSLGGRSIYVFAGAGRCGAYALSIAQTLSRRGHTSIVEGSSRPNVKLFVSASQGIPSAWKRYLRTSHLLRSPAET